ncbi:MAG: CapA family protein [Deltaproteobacteria bacterium]|nr:CapA family protein [Deltaproteobacteria bacterium]
MTPLALALALLVHPPFEVAPAAGPDVWLAFAGDIAADDAARLRPVTGPLAQADLAIQIGSRLSDTTTRAVLDDIGFDVLVRDGDPRVTRRDFGSACVVVLGGPPDRIDALLDRVAKGPCFVAVAARWSGIGKGGLPGKAERDLARSFVARGADLVVGQHPGAPAGVGWQDGTPIIWSVGSFFAADAGETGVFRARLTPTATGLALAEVDLKPLVYDAATQRMRTPKEAEVDAISASAARRSRLVGGQATLEAAHIVFHPR